MSDEQIEKLAESLRSTWLSATDDYDCTWYQMGERGREKWRNYARALIPLVKAKKLMEDIESWEEEDTNGTLTGMDWYRKAVDLLRDAYYVLDEVVKNDTK